MTSLGMTELLVLAVVVLVFVGPERLPRVTRGIGKVYGQFRRAADEFRRSLVLEADRQDEEERLRNLRQKRAKAEERAVERQAEEETGGVHQPRVHPEPERTTVELPPGFTEAEWEEVPEHIRERIMARRRGE